MKTSKKMRDSAKHDSFENVNKNEIKVKELKSVYTWYLFIQPKNPVRKFFQKL